LRLTPGKEPELIRTTIGVGIPKPSDVPAEVPEWVNGGDLSVAEERLVHRRKPTVCRLYQSFSQ
jgi:hypothetical protein